MARCGCLTEAAPLCPQDIDETPAENFFESLE
jgi:hypothetical protein